MTRLKLPIGIQTFREIREDGCYYADKTAFALRLIEQGKYYFLSRPCRFGKSLFLDTLAELFAGNEPLFRGLYVHDRWDWDTRYPVIRISFGGGVVQDSEGLELKIREQLHVNEVALGLQCGQLTVDGCFADLIRQAHTATGLRVVVLVDEYDKPILDNLTRPETAAAIRDGLRNLYSVIKDSDAHIRFAFLTGVSKFSKVSLFSGLNNLNDITVDVEYSAICGYTEMDLDGVFAPELEGLDRDEIRHWYNGYNWTGESVYNPFDVLLLFQKRQFRPYLQSNVGHRRALHRLLLANDFSGLQDLIGALFASIPSEWFTNNPIARYEGYYASVFYAYFASLGLDIVAEESSNAGRLDMAVRFNRQLYLFEFKVVELVPEGRALQQIKDRGYADKYRGEGVPIHLIGVEFSRQMRSLAGFEVESLVAS